MTKLAPSNTSSSCPSDAVGVDEGKTRFARSSADLLAPRLLLPCVIRRTVRDDDHLRACLLRLPRGSRKPDVFADDESDLRTLDVDDTRGVARLEVALLVEDRVVWQELLAVDRADAAVSEHRNGVVARAAVTLGETDDDRRAAHARRQRSQFARARIQKRRPQKQVLGRIAAQRKLGRDHEARAGALGLAGGREDGAGVPAQVSQHLIQLCDGDLHWGIGHTGELLAKF
jgi:hypothetical protein